ncbi:shikimate dehydrogenase [Caulobacter sp. S45]|uniref:shikimate dehydrogenase n=1 Tax=Caulobacter sp. S45 TaxID=1641861 RepID=UPI00131BE4AA|nr:shikimate dehydrogenase [Caulobacter sp. S45]
MTTMVSGAAMVAGVVGAPVRHSLSPLIHNTWIAAAGLDAVYTPFEPPADGFETFVAGLRRSGVRGLNVTLPFKEIALRLADTADTAARAAGAANLLLFGPDGEIEARNTDGIGLLAAFARQAPGWRPDAGPVVVLGAGGAGKGAVVALTMAGAEVRLVNRTHARALTVADGFEGVTACPIEDLAKALGGASAIVNATSAGFGGGDSLDLPFDAVPPEAVVMDMIYKPLRTPLLQQAQARGFRTVDGLAMLVGQAIPSFEALFGVAPPMSVDVRALALKTLGETERR